MGCLDSLESQTFALVGGLPDALVNASGWE
jgi:hypothetical protein